MSGGVAIAKDVYIRAELMIESEAGTISPSTGALVVVGGIGCGESLHAAGGIVTALNIDSTSVLTGAIVATGGWVLARLVMSVLTCEYQVPQPLQAP